jgi:hypothetical protein
MRDFFKGWRRKAGCVALVMACVLAGAWTRSRLTVDRLRHFTEASGYELISSGGRIWWETFEVTEGPGGNPTEVVFRTETDPIGASKYSPYDGFAPFNDLKINTRVIFAGFDIGNYQWGSASSSQPTTYYRCKAWGVPYWFFAIPLTLLSAYLILWKPRPKVERDA